VKSGKSCSNQPCDSVTYGEDQPSLIETGSIMRKVLAERLASYRAKPDEGKPWDEFEKRTYQGVETSI
jgi:hypothetical protein